MIRLHADRIGGLIDSYVGKKYDVSGWTSSSSTPQIIQSISDRLVSQYTMRSVFTQEGQNVNEWVNELADTAMDELKSIASGDMVILDSNGSEASKPSRANSIRGNRKDYTPVFDVDKDTSWSMDGDLNDAIQDSRQ